MPDYTEFLEDALIAALAAYLLSFEETDRANAVATAVDIWNEVQRRRHQIRKSRND